MLAPCFLKNKIELFAIYSFGDVSSDSGLNQEQPFINWFKMIRNNQHLRKLVFPNVLRYLRISTVEWTTFCTSLSLNRTLEELKIRMASESTHIQSLCAALNDNRTLRKIHINTKLCDSGTRVQLDNAIQKAPLLELAWSAGVTHPDNMQHFKNKMVLDVSWIRVAILISCARVTDKNRGFAVVPLLSSISKLAGFNDVNVFDLAKLSNFSKTRYMQAQVQVTRKVERKRKRE